MPFCLMLRIFEIIYSWYYIESITIVYSVDDVALIDSGGDVAVKGKLRNIGR